MIDLTVVSACLLAGSDLLIANAAGWTVAVTANFLGNYWFTYTCPAGRLSLMYVKYVASRSVTFGLRSVVALLLVGVGDVGDLWASMAGILVGVSLGFALAETVVFGGGRDG